MAREAITIATETYSRALLIQASLEEANIYCFLSNVNTVQVNVGTGVNIKVDKADEKEALQIIQDIKSHFGEEKVSQLEKLKSSRRILVPVDFSSHSVNACLWAIGVAAKLKAEVQLVHVYFNPATTVPNFGEHYTFHLNMDKFIEDVVNNAKYDLNQLTKRLKLQCEKEGVEVKIKKKLIGGIAIDAIQEECDVYKPAMIVMGTKGKGEKMDYVLGGVAHELVESSGIPVMAIPECARYKGADALHHVLYATAFDDSDFQAIGKLINLMKPFNVMLHCVHVDTGSETDWDHVKMSGLKEYIHKEFNAYNVECHILNDSDVFNGIKSYVQENNIDFISMTRRKRSWFTRQFNQGLVKDIILQSELPILVFHSK